MQVKILTDEEFESLPYPEMSTSVGVADPRTKTAYVRKTHIPIIDAFKIAHELEHLEDGHEGVHADHFRNGVYYKGFGDIAKTAAVIGANFIPGVGPIASAGLQTGFSAIDAKKQKKAAGQQQPQFQGGGGESPMQSFQPEVSQPNVIQTGGGGGGGGGGFGSGSLPAGIGAAGKLGANAAGDIFQRIRGFFSGRDPQRTF